MKGLFRVAQIMGKMLGGGVESVVMNYYRHIDKSKVQFDFIIDSDSTNVPREEIANLGGRIIEVSPYQHIFSYIKDVKKILKKNDYKIVHAHMNALSVFPLYAAKCVGVPIRIAHSHSTTNKKEWKKNLLKSILRPFSKVFSNYYFACSKHAGNWLFGNKTFNEGKVTIINNAIDTNKFKYDEEIRNKVRKDLNIEDRYVLGHVGRFVAQKNHTFLLDVFHELYKENKKIVLLLIGQGPLEDEMKEKVKQLGISDSVIFLEQRDDVNELMQAMDCFVFPSLYEGLGIVAIEAQCSGLRCICSNEVPNEIKITKLMQFIELENIANWKNEILKEKEKRKDFSKLIENSGYEIQNEVNKLSKIYLELEKDKSDCS